MMTQKRRWLLVCLCLPLVLLVGLVSWIWFQQQEPTLDGEPLSQHLLRLHAPHADVRASSLEFVKAHPDEFGPYCLQLLSKETTTMQAWLERVQTKLAPTRLGRKLGVKSPRLKLQVRAMSALALAVLDVPVEEKIQALKVGLYDADRQTRMESVKSLATLGPASLPILEPALTDSAIGFVMPLSMACILGPEAKPALESLKDLLINEDFSTDPLNYEVFWRVGPEAAEVLGQALDTANAVQQFRILKAMVSLRRYIYPYRDHFIAGLKHANPKVRSESARALMAAGRVFAEVAALLFPLLKDEESEVRLTALQLLNQRVNFTEPAIPEFLLLLEDDEKEIRRIAGTILERLTPKTTDSKEALKDALNSENIFVREVAAKALANE
jgi:HEAT repeat protein